MTAPTIRINLAGLTARIQRSLRRATNLVAIGLNAPTTTSSETVTGGGIEFRYATNEPWTPDTAQHEWVQWILLNGFRDAAESLAIVLEEARVVLAAWRLKLDRSEVTLSDWQETIGKEGRRFHRLGLPDKINFLANQYGLKMDPPLVEQILTINGARNCLVHRGGKITERDRNCETGFELHWRATVAVAQGPDGEREVEPPILLNEGEGLGIATRPRRRLFAIGEDFTVSSGEFAQVCWTLFLFVQTLAEKLEEIGRSQGIEFTPGPA
jgi:hypothetical protein